MEDDRPETAEKLAEYKARCAYREPPLGLCPQKGEYLGRSAQWTALVDWFEANTMSWHDALLVYIAERYHVTISSAYANTDSFAKSRLGIRGHN